MKILAIDTTTKFLCLGIYNNTKVYEYNLEAGTMLSSLLTPTLKRVLDALGWRISDVDYFVCGLGPGSFTGVRIGVASVKGLSFSLGKPIIGISTLDILAKNAAKPESFIVPIIDAKRNLVYGSIYKLKDGNLKRITPYLLSSVDELLNRIKPNSVLLGSAVELYKEKLLGSRKGLILLDKDYWYPQAHNIISLALERIKERKIGSAFDIKPIYLYPKECQIRNRG